MAVLTAAEIRERFTRGSPTLNASEFSDEWVEEARDVFMDALVNAKGVAYEPTETVEVVRAPGCTDRLVLRWPKVTAVDSVVVDGVELDADDYEVDENGVLYRLAGFFHPRYRATVTYTHGYTTTPPAVLQACALFVERSATQNRSTGTRDVSREGFDGGSSTVYIRAGAGNLTAFADVNDLVAALPSFRAPGIA